LTKSLQLLSPDPLPRHRPGPHRRSGPTGMYGHNNP